MGMTPWPSLVSADGEYMQYRQFRAIATSYHKYVFKVNKECQSIRKYTMVDV